MDIMSLKSKELSKDYTGATLTRIVRARLFTSRIYFVYACRLLISFV